jgi:Tetracyclin repressor-like, C-terminal domain
MCGRAQYPSGNVLGSEVLRDRVRAALRQWRDSVSEIVDAGIKRGEIRQGVDPKEAATIIISALERALMIARLERRKDALLTAQSYLERYFDTELRGEGTSESSRPCHLANPVLPGEKRTRPLSFAPFWLD